jgi:hypothetical protein
MVPQLSNQPRRLPALVPIVAALLVAALACFATCPGAVLGARLILVEIVL